MSVAGISSSSLISSSTQHIHNNLRQFQQVFQQLGSDLQSGSRTAAQQDFATLQGLVTQGNSTSPSASGSPIAQTFHRLGQDIQTGSASAAKQDYSILKQDFQRVDRAHNHHRNHVRDPLETGQGFDQPGAAPQSGDASSAQTAYNSLLPSFAQQPVQASGPSLVPQLAQPGSDTVSVSA